MSDVFACADFHITMIGIKRLELIFSLKDMLLQDRKIG
jgi:hypothetical protein